MNNCQRLLISTLLFLPSLMIFADCGTLRGTGDLLLIIERMTGSVVIAETTNNTKLCQLTGLGDLSHASVVYSRDQRYAFVFGRDGGLTKIDMLLGQINKRIIQSGNAIGGAISQDGSLVAVSNYTPGGVNIFSSETLELVAKIPTPKSSKSKKSRVVGLTDAPDKRFVFSLFDTGEIWIANMSNLKKPEITKFTGIGKQPYDGLITPDGRHYIAGLFGEDGLALLDLWHPEKGIKRILGNYGKGQKKLPVYKMPHLEGWAIAGNHAFLPAVGQHKVMVVNRNDWTQEKAINVHSQPVFAIGRPDGRQVWVNFAFPDNDTIQVIDTDTLTIVKTMTLGKGILHMEFTPRGEQVWISVRDKDQVVIFDTQSFKSVNTLNVIKPSGIFNTSRAHKIGL